MEFFFNKINLPIDLKDNLDKTKFKNIEKDAIQLEDLTTSSENSTMESDYITHKSNSNRSF
jgi:hypothetical protein